MSSIAHATAVKRLSIQEIDHWQVQGLCFNSDEKFELDHCCKKLECLELEDWSSDTENSEILALPESVTVAAGEILSWGRAPF